MRRDAGSSESLAMSLLGVVARIWAVGFVIAFLGSVRLVRRIFRLLLPSSGPPRPPRGTVRIRPLGSAMTRRDARSPSRAEDDAS
jgi:hypothetical protein